MKIINTIFALATVCLAIGAHAEVRIACNVPLTGDLATYGASVQEGVLFALSESPEGAPVTFEWEDNRGSPRETITNWRKQGERRVDVYVSGVRPQTAAIRSEITRKGIPHFMWIFDVDIREQQERNNFRTYVHFRAEAPLFIDYARKRRATRVAILYVQLPSTDEAYVELVGPEVRNQGAELMIEPYPLDTLDFNAMALRVQRFSPDLLILSGFQANLPPMVRALRNLKLIREDNTLATYDMLDAASLMRAEELEGIRVAAPKFVTRRTTDPTVAAWYHRFQDRFGRQPLYTHAYAYDMAKIIIDAAGRTGPIASSEQWIDALNQTKLSGITGPLEFDARGDLPPSVELGVYRKGTLLPDAP